MKRCLIVVDYQNDFVSGSLGFAAAARLEQAIAEKIAAYRENADTILFTLDTHDNGYLHTQEGRYLPIAHCILGSDGHQLYGQIGSLVQKTDRCFLKNTFGSKELFDYLQTERFQSIELAGVVTNICVIANAVLAKTAQPETLVMVDATCTASNDDHLQQAALDVMQSMQIQVMGR